MSGVRFLHIADLHLDSPFIGLSHVGEKLHKIIQESTFASLAACVQIAIREQVDFVLIAGDIYDSDDQSVKAQARFYQAMKELEQAAIPVFMIHGNHDYLKGNRETLLLPENVTVFPEKVAKYLYQTKNGTQVDIQGFSYGSRHVMDSQLDKYEKQPADFHIGLLHGSERTHADGHDVYAPFTTNELRSKGFDYWALGHIHKRMLLEESGPVIYYPGNIQGRNRKESGEKGATLVQLDSQGAALTFYPTAPIQWETVTLTIESAEVINTFFQQALEMIESYAVQDGSYLLDMEVTVTAEHPAVSANDLLELVQDNCKQTETSFVWVNSLRLITKKTSQTSFLETHLIGEEWQAASNELQDESTFFQVMEQLYFHKGINRFLTDITEAERTELLTEANQYLEKALAELEDD